MLLRTEFNITTLHHTICLFPYMMTTFLTHLCLDFCLSRISLYLRFLQILFDAINFFPANFVLITSLLTPNNSSYSFLFLRASSTFKSIHPNNLFHHFNLSLSLFTITLITQELLSDTLNDFQLSFTNWKKPQCKRKYLLIDYMKLEHQYLLVEVMIRDLEKMNDWIFLCISHSRS